MIFKKIMRRNAIKLVGERSASLELARGRLVLMGAFFVLAYIVLAVRAFDLSVIQGEFGAQQDFSAAAQMVKTLEKGDAVRGDIRDRNGVLLATTLKTASLYVNPHLIANPKETAQGLVEIFPNLSYGKILQDLQGSKQFIWIERNIRPEDQYAVLELGEPGLKFEYEHRRVYPQGALSAHMVGYTDIDNKGLAGVERSFEKLLSKGEDLDLSLDIRLQHALRRELVRAASEFKAKAGFGVIMDVRSGELLAGVSWPDFNPHTAGASTKDALFNRLSLGVYELGSIFKIFSTAAFLDNYDVPMSTKFDVSEPIKVGRFKIRDYHPQDRSLTIPEVFMYSSNIGSAMMGEAVGTDDLRSFYEDLGLLDLMGFELREIAHPIVPTPWRDVDTLTASYGHGLATTPLQAVAAISSIVNGGTLVHPTLIAAQKEQGNKNAVRIVSEETAHRIRQLLRLAVTEGTGKNADVKGYRVGGKTGTAEKVVAGRYDRSKLISSFVAVFPIESPRYVVFIAVDEPKGHKKSFGYATGGWVAAPAVARVIASMVSILGLPSQTPQAGQALGSSLKKFVVEKEHG